MNFGMDNKDDEYENDLDMREPLFEEDEDENSMMRWISVLFVLIALGGFVALAWYAYQSGMQPVSEDEIPYVAAEEAPLKEKPENPGGWQFEHQDKSVYNQLAAGNGAAERPVAERIIPAPEEPVARKQEEQIAPEDFQREDVAGSEANTATAETPVSSAGTEGATETLIAPPAEEAPAVTAEDAPETAVESVGVAEVEQPVAEENAPAPEAESTPTVTIVEPEAAQPAPAAVEPVAQPEPAPVTTPAPAVKTSASGHYMAQLGAFSSQEDAETAWNKISAAHGSMFPTKDHIIQRADLGAKGVFHRLQVGPFDSETSARKVCEYLQRNKQGCFVVRK